MFYCVNLGHNFSSLSGDNYVATLTLGGAGAHATYYHKANDQVPSSRMNENPIELVVFITLVTKSVQVHN